MNLLSVITFVGAVGLLVVSPEMAIVWSAIQERGFYQYLFSLGEVSTAFMLSLILLFSGSFLRLLRRVDANYVKLDMQEIRERLDALEASVPEDVAELDQNPQDQVATLLGDTARVEGRVRALQAMGHGEMATQLGDMLTALRAVQSTVVPLAGQVQEMQTLCDVVGKLLDEVDEALSTVEDADMRTMATRANSLQESAAELAASMAKQQKLANALLAFKSTLAQIEVGSALVDKEGAPLVDANGKPITLGALVDDVERLQAAIRDAFEEVDLDSLLQEQAAVGELVLGIVKKIDQLSALANALRPVGTVVT